ncbi:MAG: cyclopropane-fatty-acyl-phospholipid synthase family protein [Burkholderiales bacterium]|nr:cyclopropane-fatty-acyl-phospholipid synthase family protein [Burkholderiales bacterium]
MNTHASYSPARSNPRMAAVQAARAARRERLPLPARIVLGVLRGIEHGRLVVRLPDGSEHAFGHGAAAAELEVHDWSTFGAALASGDIGFGEAYMRGYWSSPDLAGLLGLFAANRDMTERAADGGFWGKVAHRARHLLRANTRAGSRRNIAAHYDLGNDFYALWLDPSMTYSSALFEGDRSRTLEQAQRAKYERILRRIAPRAGAHILEIGCGWGAFAELAAREYGCRVTGITLSREQLAYAEARIARAGLADRVRLELRDYRDVAGQYDHVVSIEMVEAVGERYWPAYFGVLARTLAPGGVALVQAITIADRSFARYRAGTDFIQRHIFPGGMLPSPRRFREEAARRSLAVAGEHAFGRDYAETLRRWRQAFMRRLPEVYALGYDPHFARKWEFYLAYCEAGFDTLCTDVHQFELVHAA